MPLTLRLLFHGFRSMWLAAFLALAAWLIFVPASPAERAALDNSALADNRLSLAQMRFARAVVHFAPNRAAAMISRASNGEISTEYAGMLLRDLASGGPQMQTQPDTPASTRDAGGAKFVTVD